MKSTKFLWSALIALLFSLSSKVLELNAQTIPSADRVNWSVAGIWSSLPAQANAVFQINLMPGATWDDKVQSACASKEMRFLLNLYTGVPP